MVIAKQVMHILLLPPSNSTQNHDQDHDLEQSILKPELVQGIFKIGVARMLIKVFLKIVTKTLTLCAAS